MNPLTNIKNVQKLNERELELGIIGKKSWHDEYKDSAWIFIGGLPFDLSEGDILCVFSQYGEVVNINLVRDHKTGKSKGYAFMCFEDQRSTVLSVDNLNSIKILGRTIRVDHVKEYKVPKEHGDEDDLTKQIRSEGCAPKLESSTDEEKVEEETKEEEKVDKKVKKKEKKKKKVKDEPVSSSEDNKARSAIADAQHHNGNTDNDFVKLEVKKEERWDPGYEKALTSHRHSKSSHGNRNRDSHSQSPDHTQKNSNNVRRHRSKSGSPRPGPSNSNHSVSRQRSRSRSPRSRFGTGVRQRHDSDSIEPRASISRNNVGYSRNINGEGRWADSEMRYSRNEGTRGRERSRDRDRVWDRSAHTDRHRDQRRGNSRDRETDRRRDRSQERERDREHTGSRDRGSDKRRY